MLKIWYGTESKNIDITDEFNSKFINKLMLIHIPADTSFNKLYGDPHENVVKKIRIFFNDTINDIDENSTNEQDYILDLSYSINCNDFYIWYGMDSTYIDVTYKFRKHFIKNLTKVFIRKYTNFNRLFSDPIPGYEKNIVIQFGEIINRIKEMATKISDINMDISKLNDNYLINIANPDISNYMTSYLTFYNNLFNNKVLSTKYVLELGIFDNSLKLWNDYFPYSIIYGVLSLSLSNNIKIKEIAKDEPRIILIDNKQAYKKSFLNLHFNANYIKFDIIIDRTPHTIKSLYPVIQLYSSLLTNKGILIIEDIKNPYQLNKIKKLIPQTLEYYTEMYQIPTNELEIEPKHIIVINKNKTDVALAS